MLAHMQQFLATNKDLQAAKQSIGPCISRFDPELACQPQGIFCKVCAQLRFRFLRMDVQLPCIEVVHARAEQDCHQY